MNCVDARDLACPLPLLRLKRALTEVASGESVTIMTTDSGSIKDIPAFCRQVGHQLISCVEKPDHYVIQVQKS